MPSLVTRIATRSSSGSTDPDQHVVLFIFSEDFAGTIDGETFDGAVDASLELRAPDGFTLKPIPYTRSAGTIRLVQF